MYLYVVYIFYFVLFLALISKLPKPFIKVIDSYSKLIILGQNVNLNCSVRMDVGVSFQLDWIVPDKQQFVVWYLTSYLFDVDRY